MYFIRFSDVIKSSTLSMSLLFTKYRKPSLLSDMLKDSGVKKEADLKISPGPLCESGMSNRSRE